MHLGRQTITRTSLEADRTDDRPAEELRTFVGDHLAALESSGMKDADLATTKEAADAAVVYVDALERMGASRDLIKVAADAAREILQEKHPRPVTPVQRRG